MRAMLAEAPTAYLPVGPLGWQGDEVPLGEAGGRARRFCEREAERTGGVVFPPLQWRGFGADNLPFTFENPPAAMGYVVEEAIAAGLRQILFVTGVQKIAVENYFDVDVELEKKLSEVGKSDLLEAMPPYQSGGDMIKSVTFEKTTYNGLPFKFEAGTPNVGDAVGLGAVIRYLRDIGFPAIAGHEHDLLEYATERLLSIDGLRIIGTARASPK